MLNEQFSSIDIVNFAEQHNFVISPNTRWAWKRTNLNGTTRNNFQWPHILGGIVTEIGLKNGEPCGKGLHLAKNVYGASLGGNLVDAVGFVVAYNLEDILGKDEDKVRVCKCLVLPRNFNIVFAIAEPRTNLVGANLYGANFEEMNLVGVNFYGADLGQANFRRADLREAILYGANIRGANFEGANLEDANFENAEYDFNTIWPQKAKL